MYSGKIFKALSLLLSIIMSFSVFNISALAVNINNKNTKATAEVIHHNFSEWATTKEPTCTEKGEEERICNECGYKETRIIDEKGHKFFNGICTVCGEKDTNYIEPTTAPQTPKLLQLKNKTEGIYFTWAETENTSRYRVYRKTSNSKWHFLAETTDSFYLDSEVKDNSGNNYIYTVRAKNQIGLSSYEKGISIKRICTPKLLKVYNSSLGLCSVWSPVKNAEAYRVYRKVNGGYWKYLGKTKQTKYYDSEIINNNQNEYIYTVRAEINGKCGDFEGGLAQTVITSPHISYKKNSNTGIIFKWNTIESAEKYRVYRKEPGKKWGYIGSTKDTCFEDTTVANMGGKEFIYTVRAETKNGLSGFESGLKIKRLLAPALKSISNKADGLYISWYKVEGAKRYKIYRKTDSTSWQYVKLVTTTYFYDTSLKNNSGEKYTYTVRAESDGIFSDYNSTLSAVYLNIPVISSAKNYSNGIQLKWNEIKGAETYCVYRRTANSGWSLIGETDKLYYNDTSVKNHYNTPYKYTVRARATNLSAYRSGYYILRDKKNVAKSSKIMSTNSPESYNDIIKSMEKLQTNYYYLLQIKNLGYSEVGRKIPMFTFGKGKKEALVIAGIHAREHLTVKYMLCCIEDYCRAYASRSGKLGDFDVFKLLNEYTLYIVPCANPDGLEIVLGNSPHKKGVSVEDLTEYKSNYNGVDLNRNFPLAWNEIDNGITKPCEGRFKGYKSASEKETRLLMKICDEHHFNFMLSFHVRGNFIYWGDTYRTTYNNRYKAFATDIASVSGLGLMPPTKSPKDYGGGFENWFRHKYNRPGLCIELVKLKYVIYPCDNRNYDIFTESVNYNESKYALAAAMTSKNK